MICSVWRYPLYRQDLPQGKVYCNCRTDSSILDPENEGAAIAAFSFYIIRTFMRCSKQAEDTDK